MSGSKRTRDIEYVKYVAINNGLDSEDLIKLLEITPEDLLSKFKDRMYEHRDKFIPDGYIVDEDNDLEEPEETAETVDGHSEED